MVSILLYMREIRQTEKAIKSGAGHAIDAKNAIGIAMMIVERFAIRRDRRRLGKTGYRGNLFGLAERQRNVGALSHQRFSAGGRDAGEKDLELRGRSIR